MLLTARRRRGVTTRLRGPSWAEGKGNALGTFLVRLVDGSEMIMTAGRAARRTTGEVAFENVDACGNWCVLCAVPDSLVTRICVYKVRDDGTVAWVEQPARGPWWAY